MTKKVMKGLVLMIVVVLAISIEVVMQAHNPSFSSLSLSIIPPLSLIFCIPLQLSPSLQIVILDLKGSVQRKDILPKKKKIMFQ